jgi:hypothetical protein
MDTRDPLRIGCPRCGAPPGCFCKSPSGVIFTLHEERRLVRRRREITNPQSRIAICFAAPKDTTYSGEIMDGECANNGSHAEMLKEEGLGDKDPHSPMAKKMCTPKCAKAGGKYVLYNAAAKKVYALDDQTKP